MKQVFILCLMFSIASKTFYANQHTSFNTTPISADFTAYTHDIIQDTLHEETTLHFFLKPIDFSQDGINYFFTHIYNHEMYPEFLTYDFTHLIQLLSFGKEHHCGILFIKSALQLFMQKIKITDYIDSSALEEFLIQLRPLTQHDIVHSHENNNTTLETMHTMIHDDLSHMFCNYYTLFKQNPTKFLNTASASIVKKVHDMRTETALEQEQVKKDILRFIELCIHKIVWDLQDVKKTWEHITTITYACYELLEHNMLSDVDSFHDICWSLVARLAYLINLEATTLSEQDLLFFLEQTQDQSHLLFHTKEAEPCAQEKQAFLEKVLHTLLAKKQQSARGTQHYNLQEARPALSNFITQQNKKTKTQQQVAAQPLLQESSAYL